MNVEKKEHVCQTCGWLAWFEGVCCNGSSEHRGGWPPSDLYDCEHFKEKTEDQK
jgi:hypothetical protein